MKTINWLKGAHRLAFAAGLVAAVSATGTMAAEYVAKIGHVENPDQPRHIMLEKVASLVNERTDGAVEFIIFPSSQLGKQRQLNESVQLGTIEGTVSATSWMAGFNPLVTILDIPFFLPTDADDAQELRTGEFGTELLATFDDRGFHAVSFWPFGFKNFTSNSPIKNVSDLEGQKFRVMDSKILLEQFSAFGASAIVLPFGELYTSLQNGVVDGQENPLTSIISMKFYEVQDYLILSEHGAIEDVIVFNPAWWASLPVEYQDVISQAFQEVVPELRDLYAARKEAGIELIRQSGTTVQQLSEEQKQVLRNMSFASTRDVYLADNGEKAAELMNLYEAEYKAITE
ncbi:TRAP transporter substrate-binding protein [Ruegeria atlantica]|uniref:TRAP transporter substrate-binding protein n=1 Tax=Ruegeria atlantica TaxID=81569 RepID=UPI00147DC649|nr:TRAP transporter substrate-binding protein [Ruegeria atlantica]